MQANRRNFLKLASLLGLGFTGNGITKTYASPAATLTAFGEDSYSQTFNMCGYAAPKLETVRIGFIGLGNRGPAAVKRMAHIEGVDIKGLCDLRPEKVDAVRQQLSKVPGFKPDIYTGKPEAWKKMCERPDIDLIYIATPWALHTPMAVYAMEHGKHVCVEVPAAKTIDECWQLVKTSERTRRHCMILENCCYDFFELLTLNMARQGFFGEIIHGEGAYIHDLLEGNFSKTKYWDMWRLKENFRHGNLYPTHGLGPVSQIMNLNRGDKMEYLTSMSGNDFLMSAKAKEYAAGDPFFQPFVDKSFRGNMNTTTVRTHKGRTLMIQHDVSSPRPYSRIHTIVGTKASAQKYPEPERVAIGDDWMTPEAYNALKEKYEPAITRQIGAMARKFGGHGGMDFLMDWRTIDCLRNGLPLDIDVYDAALWSAIGPLSEWSVAHRSNSIDVPDFTGGAWKTNQPVDVTLSKGGTTNII
ncbi:Gfo/Idh/MocA family protein [Chitinophaga qingshengii]|uniref:Gfo/Idh/MocA family oxidoreductase n=1 Tax=Chitinophaga qingshengii TaxID=1569794 RepID=A0ABR7TJF3_9BACT|nr:Gfo/Idh/MocA family oxidoreductase [Chitinophaga qingshengii]MBC9930574.1 Gfo/Idh/MocA family oxidoreductase [Chitinophaga qingshengii]